MAYETLRYEVADGVATVALDQPETRNALSDAVLDELLAAFAAARADAAVRCVVLTSTHEKVFSSGGNLAGFAADVPLIAQAPGDGRAVPAPCSGPSGSWASRRCAPRTGTCWPARSAWRWPAT